MLFPEFCILLDLVLGVVLVPIVFFISEWFRVVFVAFLVMVVLAILGLIDGRDTSERHVFSEYHSNGVYCTCFMVRRGDFKYVYIQGHQDQLFDLKNDPNEWQNLIGHSRTADIEKELKTLIIDSFYT